METGFLILATICTAATPLLLAALGEHVVERSGVLNLGVEGMMIMGASSAFAVATLTNSDSLGVLAGMVAGMLLATVFAAMVLGLATNQVATGLALTIFGIGAANLIGAPFVGTKRDGIRGMDISGLAEVPGAGALKLALGQDPFIYLSLLLCAFTALFLLKSRAGLMLRGIGENHQSAHWLGLPVRLIRLQAILFGGALAGLAGAYLSLVYTPFWSPGMTSGRGWIALALVIFAGGKVWRLVLGAYIFGAMTVAQLHAQAGSIPLPAQFLSALPYIATLLALILLSFRGKPGSANHSSLGKPFIPEP